MDFKIGKKADKVKYGFAFFFCLMLFLFGTVPANAQVGESHAWTHGDWSSRVLWEARYALSQNADGYSSKSSGSGLSKIWYGDWDYSNSDTIARDKAGAEGYNVVGPLGAYGSYYRGGECTYFVRLVLYRSTYWYFSDHYAMHNYPNSVYGNISGLQSDPAQFQPGWMLLTATNSHYAIAEKRETISGVSGWWVIDSNWVGSYIIGKHFMSDSTLQSQGYRGTVAYLGTWNW